MRVLHVIARLNAGGTAVYLENLSIGLTQSGVENMIATGHVQGSEVEDSSVDRLTIIRIPHLGRAIHIFNDIRARSELKRIIKEFNPTIIHSHTFKAGFLSRSINSESKRVHTFHGHILNDGSLSRLQYLLAVFIEKKLSKRTDFFISVGERVGLELREVGIGKGVKWASIPPGIGVMSLPSREVAAKRFGINPERATVGWLGRMAKVKDPHLALEVARKLPDIQFILAGDGELLSEIRNLAPPNVILPGWVDKEEVFACSNVVLMSSLSEGFPLAALEARLLGIPIVAPDVGSISEIITSSNMGAIVKRDVESLTKAITTYCGRLEKRNIFSDSSLEDGNDSTTIAAMVSKHLSIYKEVVQ